LCVIVSESPAIASRPIKLSALATPPDVGLTGECHSNTADSLLEVLQNKLFTTFNSSGTEKKRNPPDILATDREDNLYNTTLFTVNSSAKLRADRSVMYKDYKSLPVTPTNMGKEYTYDEIGAVKSDLPPLDFSGVQGSHESISFQPYVATFRSTDTVNTDPLLPH